MVTSTSSRIAEKHQDALEIVSKLQNGDMKGLVSPQEEINKLQNSITILENQIKSLALDNRDLLLDETSRFKESSKDFQKLFLSIRSLQSVAARVKAEVSEPCKKLSVKTVQLANLYETVDLLRKTTNQIKLVKKIQSELDSEDLDLLDLSKVARLLSEAMVLCNDANLAGIRVCDENTRFVNNSKSFVHEKILIVLEAGIESKNQADIGGALQALYNLQELVPSLENLIETMVQRVKRVFMNALDAKKLSALSAMGASAFTQISSQASHNALWEQIGNAMGTLKEALLSMWCVQRVLMKKKDPLTHAKFIELIDIRPFDVFWRNSMESIKDVFDAVLVTKSPLVKDNLLGGYPRLAGLFEVTLLSIMKETTEGRKNSVTDQQMDQYYTVISSLESEYLLSVQSRLDGLAAVVFSSRSLPSQVDLQSLTARFHEEIKDSQSGVERITALCAAVLGSVLLSIAAHAKDMTADIGLLSAATGCNSSQSKNLSLAKTLEELFKNTVIIQGKIPAKAARALEGPAEAVRQATHELLQPIFKARTEHFKNSIKKVHAQNFSADEAAGAAIVEASPYITELNMSLSEFRKEIASKCMLSLGSTGIDSVSLLMIQKVAMDLIECWIQHVSLIRQLTGPGRLQIAKDAAEFESILEQHLLSSHRSGRSAIADSILSLKSFVRLVYMEDANEMESKLAAMNQSLPKHVILHHLFSRCPPEIESPYARSKLTPSQYCTWMDENTEEEILKHVTTALEAGIPKLTEQEHDIPLLMQKMSGV